MKIALAHPELAPLLIAAGLIVALCTVALVRRRRALAAFAGPGARLVSADPALQVAKLILVGAACLLVVLALVGPQIGEVPRRAATSRLDTVIALDVSQSMAVRDVDIDRLHSAQRAIELLGQQLSGGRVGLTLFAGSSALRYPLTASTKIVGPALDTSGHGFRVQPGSSLRIALQGAAAQFPTAETGDLRTRAIVVISDGEDPAPDLPPLDSYLARGLHVFTLGIGTPEGGPVPVYDSQGRFQQMLVDANGTQVTSRLDEARLTGLAAAGGGRYVRYDGDTAAKTLSDALRAIDPAVAATEGGVSPEDRYQFFLGLAVVLLVADWLISERRPMPRPRVPRGRAAPRRRLIASATGLLLLVVACGPQDPIADQLDAANQIFTRDPAGAVARYRDLQAKRPAAPEISIDLGNAVAATGEHDRALVEYSRAIDTAKGRTRAIAFYDRATSLFRLGRILDARAAYVEALRLDPNDRDAKFNIEVIDRILGTIRSQRPASASSSPGASTAPSGRQQPGGSPQPTAPAAASGTPAGTPVPDATGSSGPTQPESVQSALTSFRRDLTVDEALKLLDALRGEQRGLPALLEGTGVRRGGNVDVPY
ncbi:MAG: VWA domain-containing protein [Chloroflexi bacterium]|nr:MAG: VWA domain-containing protein [Chloroflexota bacterium]